MSNLIKRNILEENNMIERRDVKPGFSFVIREWGIVNNYRVLTEDEISLTLGTDYLRWIKRKPGFVACRNTRTNLTEAKDLDIICREGTADTTN